MGLRMHSLYLRETYNDVYKDFYIKNDLVISLPHVFRWSPIVSMSERTIVMRQKLQTKIYMWVNKTIHNWVRICWVKSFNSQKEEYLDLQIRELINDDKLGKLETVVSWVLKEFWINYWIDIYILSEHMRGYGFWFMWSVFTLLSCLIHILAKKITYSDLEDYWSFIKSDIFDEIVALSLYMDRKCDGGPLWLSPRVALMQTEEPVIQFWNAKVVKKWVAKYVLEEWCYRALTLSEITHTKKNTVMNIPIDYWIISFGVAYDWIETRKKYIKFSKLYSDVCDFYNKLQSDFSLPWWETECDWVYWISRFFWLNVMKYFDKLLNSPWEAHYVNALIQTIIDAWIHDSLIDRERYNMLDTYYRFSKLKNFNEERIGLIPISTSKVWWTFLFTCRRNESRWTMNLLLDKLKEEWYKSVNYQYLSWRDWHCNEWLIVHQHISKSIYSEYVKQWSVLFKKANGDQYVWNHREILATEKRWLILDDIYWKIYINWEKLTHKHLRSQSATVEILSILREKQWQYIHNSEFPTSSYSKNKNEMIWKIILPLKTLVKETFDVELVIECKWSIFDFHVMLWEDKTIINRIFPLTK